MGVTWAIGWAVVGIMIGVVSSLGVPMEWFTRVFDAPLPALAVPGFFTGTVFSLVLGIAARRRRFNELSLPTFAAWGATGGVLLGAIPVAAGVPLGAGIVAVGTLAVLGAASATGTLLLARSAEHRAQLGDGSGTLIGK